MSPQFKLKPLEKQPNSTEPEWFAVYRDNSIQAHKLRQANDHVGAKQLFEEALIFIQEAKQKGEIDERLTWHESTLIYAILDCNILLQSTPSEVMQNLHIFGDYLKKMMIDISGIHDKFRGIAGVFNDDFTATDINQLRYAIERFEDIILNVDKNELSQQQLEKLAMFYFYLSNYFQTAQLFLGFSTMMIKEGEECKEMFGEASARTIENFEALDDEYLKAHNLKKYKDYVKKWFGIYADIMDATYALYVRDQVFDSNWAFQSKDIDMLWDNIKTSLVQESDDEAVNQMNQNAAAQAMELLLDVYSTEALMNIDNYERALTGLDKISDASEKLKEPTKVVFYNHLKRAIIARKYLLDMRYNEGLVLSQLNPVSFFNRKKQGSEDTDVAHTQYDVTDLAGVEISRVGDDFSEKTTNAIEGLVNRFPVLTIPDENDEALNSLVRDFVPTNVYEQTEAKRRELRKDDKYMEWEKKFMQQMRKDLELAKMYMPENIGSTNHMSKKWLVILEARLLLYEYFHSKDNEDEETGETTRKDSHESILEILDDSSPTGQLDRIEQLLSGYAEMPKGAYFRQIVEINIILGWVYIEKIELMKDKLLEGGEINVEVEPYIFFDKARDYLCSAFNMLQDLGDESTTLHNEIRRAYAKLKFLNFAISDSANKNETVLPVIDREAKEFRKGQWNRAFCQVLSSDKIENLEGYRKTITAEFEKIAKEFVPHIVSVNVFSDNSNLPTGTFVKNDYARDGMYKTVIKVPENSSLVLGIQSELPIPKEVLGLLPGFANHIFNLFAACDYRKKLESVKDDRFKVSLKREILTRACVIIEDLLPTGIKIENKKMREKFYKKLVASYNLRLHFTINIEDADHIAALYDAGMAAIDTYSFDKPEAELLAFEKVKKQRHVQVGYEILRGMLGTSEFNDVLIMAKHHHDAQIDLTEDEVLDEKMMFLLNILRISDRLKEFYAKEIGRDDDPEEDFKIKQFLAEQSDKDFSPGFIEFVQDALYPDDGLDFLWEV